MNVHKMHLTGLYNVFKVPYGLTSCFELKLVLHVSSSMLMYGCTRLEIGVQSVYEDVARDTNR